MRSALASFGTSGAGMVSRRGICLCLLGALGLAWPMLIFGRPLMFPDTSMYVLQGRQLVHGAVEAVSGISFDPNYDNVLQTETLRSAPYAVYLYLGSRWPLTLVVPTLLQGALVLMLFAALVRREHEAPAWAVADRKSVV